jgi:hypothetical protein
MSDISLNAVYDLSLSEKYMKRFKAQLIPLIEEEVKNQIKWRLSKIFENLGNSPKITSDELEILRRRIFSELNNPVQRERGRRRHPLTNRTENSK